MIEQSNSLNDFGLVIAYVIPGLAFLLGCSYQTHIAQELRLFEDACSVTIPALVLLIFLAVTSGLIVQTIRWLLIDSVHHYTGIKPGNWDFRKLSGQMTAFEGLTENHYRFYQFYSGMVVSILWIMVSRISVDGVIFDRINYLLVGLTILMFLGSRDTLHKYYQRLDSILTQA